jgi:hypothetical protein
MSYLLRQELSKRNRPSITAPSSTSSEHRISLAAPDAEIVIVALRHAQRISCEHQRGVQRAVRSWGGWPGRG